MRIEHLAIWVRDLEGCKAFFETYFAAKANRKYENLAKGFESYFLSFESGARLELMCQKGLATREQSDEMLGLAHLAFALGSRTAVDTLTDTLRNAGFAVLDGPRVTGDGYYESVVLDGEGNRIELTE